MVLSQFLAELEHLVCGVVGPDGVPGRGEGVGADFGEELVLREGLEAVAGLVGNGMRS